MTPEDKKELDFVLKQATRILIGAIVASLVLLTIAIIKF
jgi:hypothetical protein